jgi:broad specificity phosphatase PhoE
MTAASASSDPPATLSSVESSSPDTKTKRTFDIYPYGTKEEDIIKSGNYCHTKVVHFVRHAQGTHNVDREYRAIENMDARLTDYGKDQCRSLAENIRQAAAHKSSTSTTSPTTETTANANLSNLHESAQLVVTSPLTRCIQTSLISFPMLVERDVPFMAHSGVRETVNYNCDRRRNIQHIAKDFGKGEVDFTHIPTDHDDVWEAYEKRLGTQWDSIRESGELHVAAERGRQFMEWLQTRPERNVVVCSHCAFLRCFWNFGVNGEDVPFSPPQMNDDREDTTNVPVVRYCGDDNFAESIRVSFENCELRSLVVAFPKD